MRSTSKALIGEGVPNRRGVLVYEINSENRKGTKHRVALEPKRRLAHCTCEHFTFRLKSAQPFDGTEGQLCKHIEPFRGELGKDLEGARHG